MIRSTPISLRSAYLVERGPHSWFTVLRHTERTAHAALQYAQHAGFTAPSALEWTFDSIRVKDYNGWITTLAKVLRLAPSSEAELLPWAHAGALTIHDVAVLQGASVEQLHTFFPPRGPERFEAIVAGVAGEWAHGDLIRRELLATGTYYPPVVLERESLDGAHRIAAIRSLDNDAFIYSWIGRRP